MLPVRMRPEHAAASNPRTPRSRRHADHRAAIDLTGRRRPPPARAAAADRRTSLRMLAPIAVAGIVKSLSFTRAKSLSIFTQLRRSPAANKPHERRSRTNTEDSPPRRLRGRGPRRLPAARFHQLRRADCTSRLFPRRVRRSPPLARREDLWRPGGAIAVPAWTGEQQG